MDEDPRLTYKVNTKCVGILDNGVKTVDESGREQLIEADSVILACGMKSREEERDGYRGVAFDVINVGDCAEVGTVWSAVQTGFRAALRL